MPNIMLLMLLVFMHLVLVYIKIITTNKSP